MGRGALVVFEGIDGSGKSTVVPRVAEALQISGFPIATTREPRRDYLSGKHLTERSKNGNIGDLLEGIGDVEYFFVNRAEHTQRFVNPNLKQGISVISDRNYHSTAAYQETWHRGLFDYVVEKRNSYERMGLIERPSLVVFLDVSPDTAMKRIAAVGKTLEKYERKEFLTPLVANYHRALEELNDPFVVIDAEGPVADVVSAAYKAVEPVVRRVG